MEFIKKCNNISTQQQTTYVWHSHKPLSCCSEQVHEHRELVWWGGGVRLCLVGSTILAEGVGVCRYCYDFSGDAYTVVMDDSYDFCPATVDGVQDPLLI